MATVEELLIKQSQLISSVSNTVRNVKKLGQNRITQALIFSRMELLKEQFAEVRDIDAKIQVYADEKLHTMHPYFKEHLFAACKDAFNDALDNLVEMAAQWQVPANNQEPQHWETFRDLFNSMVIEDASLSNVERMHYLCSVLTGEASQAVRHLTVTESNFDVAWEIISSRYENKRRLISGHLQTLCTLPPLAHENAKNLQTLRDHTNMSIHALKNLGRPVEAWDDFLVFLVSRRLDETSRRTWEIKLSDTIEFPSYAELDRFLEARIRALAALCPVAAGNQSEASTVKLTKTKRVVSHSSVPVLSECILCKRPHPLYRCNRFLAYELTRRREFVQANNRCSNCLAGNYYEKNCHSEHRCCECRQRHHTLLHASFETTRLRVVFNASSRTSNGHSLNDHLLVGAKLQKDLSAIILRWRQFRYVVTADITKMYRQIRIDPRDANFQRILWRPTPSDKLKEYRLLTVTYGTASAPFLALRTLQQLADDKGTDFPLALPVLTRQLYVDDCVFGANDLGTARATRDQVVALLARGGFPLRKWASNCESLVADIDPANHRLARSKSLNPEDSLSILGIFWHSERDTFSFKISSVRAPAATKRAILSMISRLFDPLGWVTPVTVTAKILIQRLWSLKYGWNDELPPEVAAKWSAFQEQLPVLEKITVARWTRTESEDAQAEIHGFADASTRAYAAAVYLRVANPDGRVTVSLLATKSKVSPIKTLSVPRLELCAALLLARLIAFVRSELQSHTLPCYCWTDSAVTLAWLRQSPSRWKTFVANRVAKIQELLSELEWRHVTTEENPADCASRGIPATAIRAHPLWWSGPTWLGQARAEWPASASLADDRSEQMDERVVLRTTVAPKSEPWDLSRRFSSWAKLLRVTAYLMRFVRRASHGRFQVVTKSRELAARPIQSLTVGEIELARHFWLKIIQAETFPEEIAALARSTRIKTSSVLAGLNVYLDAHGLLRVRGQLVKSDLPDHSKYPIILRSHPLMTLIITETHRRLFHAGPRLTCLCSDRSSGLYARDQLFVPLSTNASPAQESGR